MSDFTIGQLADIARVNVETVRYYERRGLIPEPRRGDSGYRQYSLDSVRRIKFIKRAQALGFSLKEILELLALQVGPDADCAAIRERAQAKLTDIEAKIVDLQRMKEVLADLVAECAGSGSTSACPILALATSEKRHQTFLNIDSEANDYGHH